MKETDLAVVELSSFQLMDMKRSPQRAVVTNLAPNHLDIHKDMQEYVDAKKNIFRYQDGSGLLVLNADNDITAAFRGNGTTRFFSRKAWPTSASKTALSAGTGNRFSLPRTFSFPASTT